MSDYSFKLFLWLCRKTDLWEVLSYFQMRIACLLTNLTSCQEQNGGNTLLLFFFFLEEGAFRNAVHLQCLNTQEVSGMFIYSFSTAPTLESQLEAQSFRFLQWSWSIATSVPWFPLLQKRWEAAGKGREAASQGAASSPLSLCRGRNKMSFCLPGTAVIWSP